MLPHEHALEFIGAAKNDLYVVDRLIDDADAPDTMIGFHCQQVAEKLLKAVLANREVHFRRTHNLALLFELVDSSGAAVPTVLRDLANLVPFAAILRYGSNPVALDFDRMRTRALIEELHGWVEAEVIPS